MGWTSYNAYYYKPNGTVDVKREMDKVYSWENETRTNKVIKSTVVGSIYYCAVETIDKATGKRDVWAGIARTSKDTSDGMNFGYKDMDETEIPCYYNCPVGILELLTPTENNCANEWRKLCREEKKKVKLSDVPIGSKIKWKMWDGTEKVLIKMEPNYQFKRAWYYAPDSHTYVPSKRIVNWGLITE